MEFTKLVKRFLVVCIAAAFFAIIPVKAQTHKTALTWASVTGASGYNVYMAPGSCTGTFTKINTAPVAISAYTDVGQLDGEVRCYFVKSIAATTLVESVPSGTFLATTPTLTAGPPPALPPPGNLQAGVQ